MIKRYKLHYSLLCLLGFLLGCETTLMRDFNHHMAGNDREAAKEVLEAGLSENPNDPEANYLMGRLLVLEEEYDEANTYFNRSLDASNVYHDHIEYLKESNFREHYNDGLDAWEEDDLREAVRNLNYASTIYPDRIESYPVLGKAYYNLEEFEQAREVFQRCLSMEDMHLECGLNLANTNFALENYERSLEIGYTFLDEHPRNNTALKLLVYSYFELERYDESEEAFREYQDAQRFRQDYEALKQFATEFYDAEEIYRAESYFKECLELDPEDKEVLEALSSIYLETGDYHLMVEANERLLTLEPENQYVKQNLLLGYELIGDKENYEKMKTELGLED